MTKRGVELLNSEDHQGFIENKLQRDTQDFRSDLVHQSLLAILDSPLAKDGKINVLIKTRKGVLIKVNPDIRLPRTYKRFSGLFAQLLVKSSIKDEKGKPLLMIVKGEVKNNLPKDCRIVGISNKSRLIEDLDDFIVAQGEQKQPLAFVVQCSESEQVPLATMCPYLDDCISVSHYELASQVLC